MSSSAFLTVVPVAVFLSLAGCSRSAPRSVERVAIVAFDNLTGSPDAAWAGMAIATLAAARTAGDPKIQTFGASTLREAQARFATETISGYIVSEGGALKVVATVRDEAAGRTLRAFTASGSTSELATLADAVAAETGAPVRGGTAVPATAAMKALFSVPSEDPQEAQAAIQQALAADPQYGAAHLARIELSARLGLRDQVVAAIDAARQARLTPAQRAQVDVFSAELSGDRTARATALMRLAQQNPGNLPVWRAVADAYLNARGYDGAVRACEAILELVPDDEVALNARVYAHMHAGDLARAQQAVEEYRRRRPGSANALDTAGEVMFYFGRFAEAEKLFLETHAKNPSHLNGHEPFRAALARFMSGDTPGADTLFASFLAERRKHKDPFADIRSAAWQWMTGRSPQNSADPALETIRALRVLAAGDRDAAQSIAVRARVAARNPGVANLASLAVLLSQPSVPAAGWADRLTRALPPQLGETQARRLLGWALLLDKKPAEAAQVWRQVYEATPAETANTERILLTWALVDAGHIDEARKVMPYGFLPPAALEPGLDLLAYPRVLKLRHQLKP